MNKTLKKHIKKYIQKHHKLSDFLGVIPEFPSILIHELNYKLGKVFYIHINFDIESSKEMMEILSLAFKDQVIKLYIGETLIQTWKNGEPIEIRYEDMRVLWEL